MEMAARLTDKRKKKIIADYVQLGSYNAVAKKHGVADSTVKRVVLADPNMQKKAEQKKEQNTADILTYMDSKKSVVCEILGKGLSILNDEEKLRDASPAQITTALGTLIDKWTAMGAGIRNDAEEDALSRSLRELGKELESDE